MKKLHILHVIGKLNAFGGTPAQLYYQITYPTDYARHTVCCMEKDGHMADKFREAGVEVITLGYPTAANPMQLFDLIALIRKLSVDVIHTTFARSNTYGRVAALLTGKPVVLYEHGIMRHTSPVINFFDNILNTFTKSNVSNSLATLESVKRSVRMNTRNMKVIYNGVPDTFDGPPWPDQDELKKKAGLSPDDFLIMDVGSHIPLRNHETLVRAIGIVKDKIPNVKCVLIGDGPTHPILQSEIQRLGIQDNVQLWKRRPREEVHATLPAADLYVNPTLEEGFGIATVEAMLCERPVICARASALIELFEDGKQGLFFTPENEQDLADRIIQLHGTPEKARQLGVAARKHALESFSVEKFVYNFEKIYYEAAGRSHPSPQS